MATNRDVLLSLGRKLTQFEAAGNTEKVKATKARIRQLEKAEQPDEPDEAPAAEPKKPAKKKDD